VKNASEIEALALELAVEFDLDPHLIQAICLIESSNDPRKARFEPSYLKHQRFHRAEFFKTKLGQTLETEEMMQCFSWGPMQVMGVVARELGFDGYLTELAQLRPGMRVGCLVLQNLVRRFGQHEPDIIASYNGGSPRHLVNGQYFNQEYVDKVSEALKALRS
jgi:hypothetical protein